MPAWESEPPFVPAHFPLKANLAYRSWRQDSDLAGLSVNGKIGILPPRSVDLDRSLTLPARQRNAMPLYVFIWNMLAWSLTVAVMCPLTIPWAYLAYKIWHGNKEIEEDFAEEIWSRSWRASLYFAVFAALFAGGDYFVLDWADFPPGVVHIVFLCGFLGLAAGIMVYCFSMEDYLQGLNLAVIYLYLPTSVFVVLWWLIEWNWLFTAVRAWLKDPTTP
jgi:hypothetical protein